MAGSRAFTGNAWKSGRDGRQLSGAVSLALVLLNTLRRAGTPTDGRSVFGANVPIEVSITTAEDIHVDDSTARVDVGVDLLVKGTPGEPALGGELRAREGGAILVGANVYRLVEGQVAFRDPARIVPSIDFLAETRVGEFDVVLDISGNAERVSTRITSTPPLPQRDLVARTIQCATRARRTSGCKFHPSNRRFDSVATCTPARVTSSAKLQRPYLQLGD